jgi:hypothetical protein
MINKGIMTAGQEDWDSLMESKHSDKSKVCDEKLYFLVIFLHSYPDGGKVFKDVDELENVLL